MNSYSLNAGDIVMLSGYGNDKFLVCRGWYSYEGFRRNGWYFKKIPEGTVIPESEVDLSEVTIVTSDSGRSCPPAPPMPTPPCPPAPPQNLDNVLGAFVSVETIDDRNSLCFPYPPNGKIVRVNNVQGETKYYVWDSESCSWKDFEFASTDDLVRRLDNLEARLETIENSADWVLLDDLMNVISAIKSDKETSNGD